MMDEDFQDFTGQPAGQTTRFRTRHAAFDHFQLAFVMTQWSTGLQFVFTDGGNHRLTFRHQIYDAIVDLVQSLAQLQ
jgi:hypothetical protein